MNIIDSIKAYVFKRDAIKQGYDEDIAQGLWVYYQRLENFKVLQGFIGKGLLSCNKELLFGTAVLFSFLSESHVEWYIKKLQKAKYPKQMRDHLNQVCQSLIATMLTLGYAHRSKGDWPEEFDKAVGRILADVLAVQIGEESVETYTDMLMFNIRRNRRTVR